MTTIRGDGHMLVDDAEIPVRYSVTRSNGADDISISFASLADYGRCRDGKTVIFRSGNGSRFKGFITGAFGERPVRFVMLSDD